MKRLLVKLALFFPLAVPGLISCVSDVQPAILGDNWQIVTDSTTCSSSVVWYQVYTGQTGDYFDIRQDGKIYFREGAQLDTIGYALTSSTTMSLTNFGGYGVGTVKRLTATDATILCTEKFVNPGINCSRSFHLKR